MTTLPTDAETDAIREAILDAAEESVIELGFDTRLHAVIAQRAGVSRPTLYKYVGDQPAIFDALFQREIGRFFVVLEAALRDQDDQLEARFIDSIVFAVQYARSHRLLQKGLQDNPEIAMPWFTGRAKAMIALTVTLLTPHFETMFTAEQLAKVSPIAVSEWAFRIISSLIITDGIVDISDEASLREFVRSLLTIAFLPAGSN